LAQINENSAGHFSFDYIGTTSGRADGSGTEASQAMSLLQQVSSISKAGFPSSVTATSDANYYKLCIDMPAQRQAKLRGLLALSIGQVARTWPVIPGPG
jgi:hypothetical protein